MGFELLFFLIPLVTAVEYYSIESGRLLEDRCINGRIYLKDNSTAGYLCSEGKLIWHACYEAKCLEPKWEIDDFNIIERYAVGGTVRGCTPDGIEIIGCFFYNRVIRFYEKFWFWGLQFVALPKYYKGRKMCSLVALEPAEPTNCRSTGVIDTAYNKYICSNDSVVLEKCKLNGCELRVGEKRTYGNYIVECKQGCPQENEMALNSPEAIIRRVACVVNGEELKIGERKLVAEMKIFQCILVGFDAELIIESYPVMDQISSLIVEHFIKYRPTSSGEAAAYACDLKGHEITIGSTYADEDYEYSCRRDSVDGTISLKTTKCFHMGKEIPLGKFIVTNDEEYFRLFCIEYPGYVRKIYKHKNICIFNSTLINANDMNLVAGVDKIVNGKVTHAIYSCVQDLESNYFYESSICEHGNVKMNIGMNWKDKDGSRYRCIRGPDGEPHVVAVHAFSESCRFGIMDLVNHGSDHIIDEFKSQFSCSYGNLNKRSCITETFDEVPAGQNFVISGERRRCLEKGIGSAKLAVFDSCRLANGTDIQIGESINRLKSGELIPFNKDNNMHIYTCTMVHGKCSFQPYLINSGCKEKDSTTTSIFNLCKDGESVCDPFSNTNNCIPINECHRICLDRQEGPFCDCRGPPICNDTTTCTVKPKDKEGTTKLPKTTTTSIQTTAPPEWCTEKDVKTSLPSSTTTEKYSTTKITIPEETTTSVQSTSTKEQHATTSVINLSTTKKSDTIQTETSTTPKISTSTEQYSTSTEQYSTSTEQYSTSTEQYSTSTEQYSTSTEQYSTSTEQYSTSTEQYSTSTEYTVTRDGNWTTSSQDSTTPELNTTPKEITTTTVTYINSTIDSTTSPTTISHVTNSTSEVKTSTEPSSPLHCSNETSNKLARCNSLAPICFRSISEALIEEAEKSEALFPYLSSLRSLIYVSDVFAFVKHANVFHKFKKIVPENIPAYTELYRRFTYYIHAYNLKFETMKILSYSETCQQRLNGCATGSRTDFCSDFQRFCGNCQIYNDPCSEGHEAFTKLVEYLCPETCLVTTTKAKVLAENWDMLSSVLHETQACYMKNP